MTDSRNRGLAVPGHLGVILGLSTGAYALTIAAVTGLQSSAEATARAERAPTVAAVGSLTAGHDELAARLESARTRYQAAAGSYAATGIEVADLEARLSALAAAASEVGGVAASLPSSVKLPPVSRSVTTTTAPATQATTGASGG